MLRLIGIIILCVLFFSNIWAQDNEQTIARIDRIKDIKKKKYIKKETDRVKVKRQQTGDWFNAAPDTCLFRRDRILVAKDTRVELELKGKYQQGMLVLAPDSPDLSKEKDKRTLPVKISSALYEIREETDSFEVKKLGLASVLVERGSLVADWAHGKLSIIAANIRTLFTGTEVSFTIDSTGTEGFIFLKSGSLKFPDYPDRFYGHPSRFFQLHANNHHDIKSLL